MDLVGRGPVRVFVGSRLGFGEISVDSVEGRLEPEKLEAGNYREGDCG